MLVTTAGLIEDDIRFGALFAALQAPLLLRRPCVGLLSWLLAGSGDDHELAWRCQRLARRGILQVTNTSDPRAEWVVQLPVAVGELVQTGTVSPDALPADLVLHRAADFLPLDRIWMAPELADQIRALPQTLLGREVSAVVLRGLPRSGRRTLLGAVAARDRLGPGVLRGGNGERLGPVDPRRAGGSRSGAAGDAVPARL